MARWDREARRATCGACLEASEIQRGEPGASAARRHEQLHRRREQRAHTRFGRLSGVYLAFSDEPQSTKAWAAGSEGEQALGRFLETLRDGESIVVLHDRRITGKRANVDHIAVTPTGVHVIDAKNYTGKVERIDRGGWLATDWRLQVGGRDRTKLVHGLHTQVDAIRAALGQPLIEEFELEIRAALCFVAADWSLFARPFEIEGVWTGWAKALAKRLQAPGALEPPAIGLIARRLAAQLPCA
jgi:Nuclease-related domain